MLIAICEPEKIVWYLPRHCQPTKKMTEAVKKAKELSLQEQRIVYVESDEKPLEPLTIYA